MEIKTMPMGKTLVTGAGSINLPLTLDCGQAFRWKNLEDGYSEGIAYGKYVRIKNTEEGIIFENSDPEDIEKIWSHYFSFDTDYDKLTEPLLRDSLINSAHSHYGTIRILNQEPWETLCSFIISSCNNIPRIKGIIEKLCEAYGKKSGSMYTFPTAGTLAVKTPDDLAFLRAGYRAPYIIDAARKVADGEINFDKIKNMSEDEARKELIKIKGVGRKVADCTLLFSLEFTDVYPVDVHIKRATEKYYPEGLPEYFHPVSGLAQQYIFHYQRMGDDFNNKN